VAAAVKQSRHLAFLPFSGKSLDDSRS
jgi:hypothetical protein